MPEALKQIYEGGGGHFKIQGSRGKAKDSFRFTSLESPASFKYSYFWSSLYQGIIWKKCFVDLAHICKNFVTI
jgi:hypothetical protein